MTGPAALGEIDEDRWSWWRTEPHRLVTDRAELADRFPGLVWAATDTGTWQGRLPMWPFDRPQPVGLTDLLADRGLQVRVRCGQAYPVVAPAVFALDPEPALPQRTQHRWHVNGDGSLCLLAASALWTGRQRLGPLLLKAAGWHIEYALMTAGVIDTMSANGIVNDPALDTVIADTAGGRR